MGMQISIKQFQYDTQPIAEVFAKIKKLQAIKCLPHEKQVIQDRIRTLRSELQYDYAYVGSDVTIKLGPHERKEEIPGVVSHEMLNEIVKGFRAELRSEKRKKRPISEARPIKRDFMGITYEVTGAGGKQFNKTTAGVFTKPGTILSLTGDPAQRIKQSKAPHPKIQTRFVGTELEFICKKNKEDLYKDFINAKLAGNVYLKTDSSIGGYKSGEFPWEVNILCREDEMRSVISRVCEVIKNAGGRVNDTCGMHMHFDMRNRDYVKCYNNMVRILPTLTAIVPQNRVNNRYCETNRSPDVREPGPRRSAINLEAYHAHKTIEVRLHSGTLSPKKICNWFALIKCAVDCETTLGQYISPLSFGDIFDIRSKLREYIKIRADKFARATYNTEQDEQDAEQQYELAI